MALERWRDGEVARRWRWSGGAHGGEEDFWQLQNGEVSTTERIEGFCQRKGFCGGIAFWRCGKGLILGKGFDRGGEHFDFGGGVARGLFFSSRVFFSEKKKKKKLYATEIGRAACRERVSFIV